MDFTQYGKLNIAIDSDSADFVVVSNSNEGFTVFETGDSANAVNYKIFTIAVDKSGRGN